jgi:hypothetical protein
LFFERLAFAGVLVNLKIIQFKHQSSAFAQSFRRTLEMENSKPIIPRTMSESKHNQMLLKGARHRMWSAPRLKSLLLILLVGFLAFGTVGCKSSKKAARLAKEREMAERARAIEQAKIDLQALLDDASGMSIDAKERELNRIKGLNLDDAEVNSLIRLVEDKIAAEKAAMSKPAPAAELSAKERLNNYFQYISNAGSVNAANSLIDETLSMFSSPNAPLLIIINRSGGIVDYDRPSTIKMYLEYLKDQKKNLNAIDEIVFDNNGKIKEIVLIKK